MKSGVSYLGVAPRRLRTGAAALVHGVAALLGAPRHTRAGLFLRDCGVAALLSRAAALELIFALAPFLLRFASFSLDTPF